MRIDDVLGKKFIVGSQEIELIHNDCSAFLKETAGFPVYKLLPISYANFQKVKVRQQKKHDTISEAFDKAFEEYNNLRQRAIFGYGYIPKIVEGMEPFYIFLPNQFKYLYSKEVTNSTINYQNVLSTLFEKFENDDKAIEIVIDLLKYTYDRENLVEAIAAEAEIIFYNVPSYYVMRVSTHPIYNKLLST